MGLASSSFRNFKSRVDATLRTLFPATLVIEGLEVEASGAGGKTLSEFLEGGESATYRFPFRVPRDATPVGWNPRIGGALSWIVDDSITLQLEIIETAVRVRDDVWSITCRHRRA